VNLNSTKGVHALQRLCNIRHTITNQSLQASVIKKVGDKHVARYEPSNTIRSGWYMMTVKGHACATGTQFRCVDARNTAFNLLITAKPQIKRIVFFQYTTPWLDIECEIDVCAIEALQLSLVKVSATFAVSRMRRKFAYATSGLIDYNALTPSELYWRYSKRFEISDLNSRYGDWYWQHQSRLQRRSKQLTPSSQLVTLVQNVTDSALKDLGSAVAELDTPYLCLIGASVTLHEYFVPLVEHALVEQPDAMLLYTDHDVVSYDGVHSEPCFKPGWNPEMLLNGNYIGHVIVVSCELFQRLGSLDFSLGESCIYEYLLRAREILQESAVCRLPYVLYSYNDRRRGVDAYLSLSERDNEVRRSYVHANLPQAKVKAGLINGTQRVAWELPEQEPRVDIIIPSRDKMPLLRTCVESVLEKTDYKSLRITVVDNGSKENATHQYYTAMLSDPRFNLIHYEGDFNFSAMNNLAVARTKGDVLVLLNNDTEVINPQWLRNMVAQASRSEVGCVGAKLHYSNGLIQHAGVILGLYGMAGHAHRLKDRESDGYCGRLKIAHNVSAVTAACLAVRRKVYLEVGCFDEVNLKVAYNDVDFCLRVRAAGYQNIWTPHAQLFHYESVSRGSEDTWLKRQRFKKEFDFMQSQWIPRGYNDIAYNPNLARDQEDFSLAA